MRWLFLVPLITSLTTAYISQRTADEIAYLTGAFAVLSLSISLVMAPWQIQLSILVLGFIIARQLWRKLEFGSQLAGESEDRASDRAISTANEVEGKTIRKYRGVSYETTSASSVPVIETEGKYRGSPCKVHTYQQSNAAPPKVELKYRGASIANPEADRKE
jgi:Domain of unknown function (DUF4278)